jgi:hypothetical protein
MRPGTRAWRCGTAILLALVATLAAADDDAARPAHPRDQLLVTGQLWDMSTGATGGEIELDWIRPFSTRSSMLVGAVHNNLGNVSWTFGKLGGAWKVGPRTGLHAEAHLGRGSGLVSDFGYQVYRLGVTQTLIRGKLLAELEDQWVDIGPMFGNMVKVGLIVPTGRFGEVGVSYTWSTSGNLESSAATARLLFRYRRVAFLAGGGVGEAAAVAAVILPGLNLYSTNEFYVGVRFPAGSIEMSVVLDSLEAGTARRNALILGFKFQL